MLVFLNGKYLSEDQAVVSVFDRSFLYGDGLFETMLVLNGKPFRLDQHIERLRRGAEFLKIPLPFPAPTLREFGAELIRQNQMPDAILRLHLSRGVGPRGYSVRDANQPTLVMSLHPQERVNLQQPPQWRFFTSSLRLPANELPAEFKTANKLPQILARAEAEAQAADEGLLLNTDGHVVEAANSNLFWVANGVVCTPPLNSGILPGVTRAVVFELCGQLGIPAREENITPENLRQRDAVFLSLSTLGIVEAAEIDGHVLRRSELTSRIWEAYWALVRRETT